MSAPFFFPLLLFLSVFFANALFPGVLTSAAHAVAAPIWRVGRFFERTLESGTLYLFSKQALLRELRELRRELQRYELLLLDRRALLEENAALKAEVVAARVERPLRAAVLVTPPRSVYDTLIIGAGEGDGVAVGDEVRVGAVALGTIREVSRETALVELFSTPGRKSAVRLLHHGVPLPVEAVGEGAGTFRITVPRTVAVDIKDPIILPGESPVVIGAVEAIRGGETGSFSTIYFKHPVSLWSLWYVDIIKGSAVSPHGQQ